MDKNYFNGVKFALGFFSIVFLLFGLVYAVGFHTANEILSGTFSGNYSFMDGNVGIGTSDPTAKLEINGSLIAEDLIYSRTAVNIIEGGYPRLNIDGNETSYKAINMKDTTSNEQWQISHRVHSVGNLFLISFYNGSTWVGTPFSIDTEGKVGIGTSGQTTQLEVACPSGFTNVKAADNQLGCMQTAEEGTGTWDVASENCFDTYGGRLPLAEEWRISMNNYALTDEIDDWEWNSNTLSGSAGGTNSFAMSGNGAITTSWQYGSTSYAYRCWIPR